MEKANKSTNSKRSLYIKGIASMLIASLILTLFKLLIGFDLASFTIIFVVPIGAIFFGAMSTWGYYRGAKKLKTDPSTIRKRVYCFTALAAYFLSEFITFRFIYSDSIPLFDLVSFIDYYLYTVTTAELSFFNDSGSELATSDALGLWGFVVELFILGGFIVGGLITRGWHSNQSFCFECDIRRNSYKLMAVQPSHHSSLTQFIEERKTHPINLSPFFEKAKRRRASKIGLWLKVCPMCDSSEVKLQAQGRDKEWYELTGFPVEEPSSIWRNREPKGLVDQPG